MADRLNLPDRLTSGEPVSRQSGHRWPGRRTLVRGRRNTRDPMHIIAARLPDREGHVIEQGDGNALKSLPGNRFHNDDDDQKTTVARTYGIQDGVGSMATLDLPGLNGRCLRKGSRQMPELPEAETLRQPISRHFSGRLLISVIVGPHPEVHLSKPPECMTLRLQTVDRTGKVLLFHWLDPGSGLSYRLVSRLGMAGTWLILPPDEPDPAHTQLSLSFSGGADRLVYRDPRRFGRLEWLEQDQNSRILDGQGPDILSISPEEWHYRMSQSSRTVRTLLLDQKLASGIGNIYASEILFWAGISPFRKGKGLSRTESRNLLACARKILEDAIISGGSSIHSFRDSSGQTGEYQKRHQVYGQEGGRCPNCQGTIRKVREQNRSLFYCPACQKKKVRSTAGESPESFPAFPPPVSGTGFPDPAHPSSR